MFSTSRSTAPDLAWLLPVSVLFFLSGIMLGRIASTWLPGAIILALACVSWAVSRGWRRTFAAGLAALAVGTMLGWHAYHPARPAEGTYAVQATVADEIHLRDDGQVRTVLTDVTLDGVSAPDAYWSYYLSEGEALPEWLVPGVRLTMTARVYHPSGQENPGSISFDEYLLQRGIAIGLYGRDALAKAEAGFSLRGTAAALRHSLAQGLMDVMGEEAGAFAAAMLLGIRDFIAEDEIAAFRTLCIAHILSVSGYHVAVLAGMMLVLLRPLRLGRHGRIGLEALVLTAYCLLTGGNAPVIRAALMLLWQELTRLRNRRPLPLHLLCVTALLQLLFNPALLFSPSFQLTYGAMLGMLLVFPRLKRRRPGRIPIWLWESICAAGAAQLGILLPELYWFGELPLCAVLLNIPVMAVFGGLMALNWAVLVSLPVPGLRTVLGAMAGAVTQKLLSAVQWLSAQGFATLWTRRADGVTFLGWGLLMYGLSILVPERWKSRRVPIALVGVLLIALILVPLPENATTYIQFSVGDADAAVLQDQNMTVVLDTGEDGRAIANYLHQNRQSVEILIVTHLHTDHGGGIRALLDEGIPVALCYLPADAQVPDIDEDLLTLMDELRGTGTEIRTLSRGDSIPLPSGCLTVLWPEAGRVTALHDANDTSLVLYADIAGVTMLLTADLPGVYESYIALPADVLKVAHHGSSSSTGEAFLAAVQPQLMLLSNSQETRESRMIQLAGEIPLYSTRRQGGIILRFPGEGVVEVQTMLKGK